jgi:hypothetical protein
MEVPQMGGQITFLPTATFRSQATNLAVLLHNLKKLTDIISPEAYDKFIKDNEYAKEQQEKLINTVHERATALEALEKQRLEAGKVAIDKVITQLQQDKLKIAETYPPFETSMLQLEEILTAAVAKEAELEARYHELESEQGGMFGGGRRVKRKRTRKARRASRKATRKN